MKRWGLSLFTGTFHKIPEKAFGVGFATRPNSATEFIRELIGGAPKSYANLALMHVSKTGKAMALGFGAYYT